MRCLSGEREKIIRMMSRVIVLRVWVGFDFDERGFNGKRWFLYNMLKLISVRARKIL